MRTVFPALSLATVLALGALHPLAQAATGASRGEAPHDLLVGVLDIESDPPAKIKIDDKDTGKITPEHHLELTVGHHKLTLETKDGAHKRSLGFNIQAGAITKLTLHLSS
jgi:hypothetical protein